jgi:hypothetical protein
MNVISQNDIGILNKKRLRSGSPGSRQVCQKLIKDSMNSEDPK